MLVTGAPGGGASALVTNWAADWAAVRPVATVVIHHCDADAAAGEFRLLAARLIAAFGGDHDAAADRLADAVPSAVASALAPASQLFCISKAWYSIVRFPLRPDGRSVGACFRTSLGHRCHCAMHQSHCTHISSAILWDSGRRCVLRSDYV